MDIGWGCRCATSYCDLDLTFNLATHPLPFKSCPGHFTETVTCRKLILDRDTLFRGVGVQCDDMAMV